MKGNPQIIAALNQRLIEELTGINQYSIHRAMVGYWGYQALAAYLTERIDDETRHYNVLLDRIVFLDGIPAAGIIGEVQTGDFFTAMLLFDQAKELDAISRYNETIQLCVESGDDDTRRLLEGILADEIDHERDIETNLIQINQMTLSNFLSAKIGG